MSLDNHLPWQQAAVILHTQRLCHSFEYWTGQPLLNLDELPEQKARSLFEAPFAVLSHGLETDPILNYGNQIALDLWQMNWHNFTQMPSRQTAEPLDRQERDRLLAQATVQGYLSNYRGVRISSTGQRFLIEDAIIWDVLDQQNLKWGQAAMFNHWQWIA